MKQLTKSGAALAAAALTMAVGFTAFTAPASQAAGENEKCYGVNACKGRSDCKTASSSCKGQNNCKGQGIVMVSPDLCRQLGGKSE